ncbi:MAG: DegV family protein [Oscillospiraceae bacterium]|nr:DegV family protein [Oscillospiraceae bacterium]
MDDFILVTDSAADIAPDVLEQWGVPFVSLTYQFDDEPQACENFEKPFPAFYQKMRSGGVARTSAINMDTFKQSFTPFLEQGKDLLYISFSSGLSTTFQSSRLAMEELREQFPERKLMTVDSLAASAGQGLLVKLAVDRKNAGASIEEVKRYVENTRLHVDHWFTVDDLVYLKRGGRVSAAKAFVGGLLNIKPVLHVDNDGHLINMSKARGRKASLKALADKFGELVLDRDEQIFISHGDCLDDAKELERILRENYGAKVSLITEIGPVIGAHSGPGTMALFFVGRER